MRANCSGSVRRRLAAARERGVAQEVSRRARLTSAGAGSDAQAELDRCTVNDPSPTALNIRSKPNGDVIGHLSNGVTVRVLRRDEVNGKAWALIEPLSGRGETGWAFARYLDCDSGE